MAEWVKDLTLGGMAVVGLIYVAINLTKKETNLSNDNLATIITENTKIINQLSLLINEQQTQIKETFDKQQEVLQGLVLSVHELVILTRETLDRIKHIEK